jgi:hypothetical protein
VEKLNVISVPEPTPNNESPLNSFSLLKAPAYSILKYLIDPELSAETVPRSLNQQLLIEQFLYHQLYG